MSTPEINEINEINYEPLDEAAARAPSAGQADLRPLSHVPVDIAVELGRTRMTLGETLELRPGSIVSLDRVAGGPADLLVNGKPIARGEVVIVDEVFGLRITELVAEPGELP